MIELYLGLPLLLRLLCLSSIHPCIFRCNTDTLVFTWSVSGRNILWQLRIAMMMMVIPRDKMRMVTYYYNSQLLLSRRRRRRNGDDADDETQSARETISCYFVVISEQWHLFHLLLHASFEHKTNMKREILVRTNACLPLSTAIQHVNLTHIPFFGGEKNSKGKGN